MSTTHEPTLPLSRLILSVFLPFAAGHYISFVFRSINAVLAPYLTSDLAVSAGQLGLLTGAYFLAFALAQLPVGFALDRWGPRRVQLVLLGIAAAGSILFAIGGNFYVLFAARVLIGFGLAACFMSSIKAMSYWVDKSKLPTVHSSLIAIGGIGAMSATLPVSLMLHAMSWRTVFLIMAAVTAAAGLAIFILSSTEPPPHQVNKLSLSSMLEVTKNPNFRKTLSLLLVPHAVAFGLQGLWIGQWLHDCGALSNEAVARTLFIGMAAIVVGSLSVGFITEWAGKCGYDTMTVAGVGVLLFIAVQLLALAGHIPMIPYVSVAFTLTGTIGGLDYTIVAQSVPPAMTGRASTCLNLLIFVGAFIVQTGFGLVLGLWPAVGGSYPSLAYRVAFAVIIAAQVPGVLGWLADAWKSKLPARETLQFDQRKIK